MSGLSSLTWLVAAIVDSAGQCFQHVLILLWFQRRGSSVKDRKKSSVAKRILSVSFSLRTVLLFLTVCSFIFWSWDGVWNRNGLLYHK